MKNTIKLFGIIALVAVIGFSLTSCDGSSGGGGNFDFTATFRNNSSVAVTVEHDGGSWAGGSGFTLQPEQERPRKSIFTRQQNMNQLLAIQQAAKHNLGQR